jgi:hypothetical protein
LFGLKTFDERFALDGLGVFRAIDFWVVKFRRYFREPRAMRDLAEERIAPPERFFDDEMKRFVGKNALTHHRHARAGAIRINAGENVGRVGRTILDKANQHGSPENYSEAERRLKLRWYQEIQHLSPNRPTADCGNGIRDSSDCFSWPASLLARFEDTA